MRFVPAILLTAVCLQLGCGGSPSGSDSAASRTSPQSASAAGGTGAIGRDVVDTCAGFTPEKAAALLGVQADTLTDYSGTAGDERVCLYRDPNDYEHTVSFNLTHEDSVQAARGSMAAYRENFGEAQRVIDGATGSTSAQAAVQAVGGMGDEAFFSPVSGAVTFRVANVIVELFHPEDVEQRTRVAAAVIEGLKS